MPSLAGQTLFGSYKEILKIGNSPTRNTGISGTLQTVEDGDGVNTALRLSSAGISSTGTLAVTGNSTLGGTLGVTGLITATGGVGGALNGSVGATTPSTGAFTTLSASSTITSAAGTAAAPAIVPTGDTNTGIFFPAADTIAFSEGGTEAMRIDSSGNVGIGTTGPTAQVTIGKVIDSATLPNTPSNHSISLYPPTTTNFYGGGIGWSTGVNTSANICAVDGGGSGALGLVFSTGNNTGLSERLRIDSSGNVGIGTTSPATKLTVSGTNGTGSELRVSSTQTNTSGRVTLYENTAGCWEFATTAGANSALTVKDLFNNAERLRIDSSGNVGIGLSNPENKLHLVGSFGRGAPVTKTANFTLADTENWIINNKSGSSCTVTFPAASSWTGREVTIKTIQAQTVVSASSNVVPRAGGSAGTAILAGTAGNWATLVSDGTNWIIMCGS